MHESVVIILNKNSKSTHCSFAKLLTFSHRRTVMMVAWEKHYVLKSESIRQCIRQCITIEFIFNCLDVRALITPYPGGAVAP